MNGLRLRNSFNVCYSEILNQTADSIESVPNTNLFTCATYQLLERNAEDESSSAAKRIGSVILYEINDNKNDMTVKKLQTIFKIWRKMSVFFCV